MGNWNARRRFEKEFFFTAGRNCGIILPEPPDAYRPADLTCDPFMIEED